METPNGYEFVSTFWDDFSIADIFGKEGIQDTFNNAFKSWKSDHIYLTELVIVLNWKCWQHYDNDNLETSKLYQKLYEKASDYAVKNLKGDELAFYLRVTD